MTYGVTLKLDDDGEIVFDGNNTLMTVEGGDKVQQDLKVLLRTEYGEDIFHTMFGFNMMNVMKVGSRESVVKEITDALVQYQYLRSIVEIIAGDLVGREIQVDAMVVVDENLQVKVSVGI